MIDAPAGPRATGRAAKALGGAVLSMALAAGCSTTQPPAAASGPLEATAPAGPTSWPVTFKWRGARADTVVVVRVYDEAERVVYGIEARGQQAVAPDELRPLLEAGTSYLWRVARLNENGQEVGESAMTAFSLR